jgi:TatA/E family protein of Tat protein translocase
MFDIGLQEMLVIGVIALLVFGPSKLPELGRMVGRALREFRRASDEFRQTVETNLNLNDVDPVGAPSSVPTVETAPPPSTFVSSSAEPLAAADAPAATATAAPAEPFCAQRGSRLFHRTDCTWTARIPEGERAYFPHVVDARGQGYVGCPVCEPWEPA